MNILKRKQFLSLSLLVILFCCSSNNTGKAIKVTTVIHGTYVKYYSHHYYSYYYDKEDTPCYVIDKDTFVFRSKATYDENGIISELLNYYPMGSLKYSKDDILNDIAILNFPKHAYNSKWKYLNDSTITHKQDTLLVKNVEKEYDEKILSNWKYINDSTITNKPDTLLVKAIGKENGKKILLNRQDDKIVIFELLE